MYQGETITTTISGFPVPVSEISDLRIIFWNNAKILLEKTLVDCTVSEESISFELSQEESLSLCEGLISRSVVFTLNDGSRIESNPSAFIWQPTSKEEVLE